VLRLDDRARARRQARELQRLARAGEEGKKLTATGTLKIDGKVLSGARGEDLLQGGRCQQLRAQGHRHHQQQGRLQHAATAYDDVKVN
jgi:hypothetical protein